MPIDPKLQPFNTLVGTWEIEATHPMFPSTVVHGSAEFEWLEGERFLLLVVHRETVLVGADDDQRVGKLRVFGARALGIRARVWTKNEPTRRGDCLHAAP
jgi:hypothetical protein